MVVVYRFESLAWREWSLWVVVSGLKQDEDHGVIVDVIRNLYYRMSPQIE